MASNETNRWVEQHGGALLRFASLHIGDPAAVEELVQETLLAALRRQHAFEGRAAERTWLIGILRHKIIDHIRALPRRPEQLAEADPLADFTPAGRWRGRSTSPLAPDEAAASREFWDVMRICLAELPGAQRAALVLRDLDGLEIGTICEILAVTPTNLATLLHRARLHLRRELERRGFGRR